MLNDPIVEEVRKVRDEHAKKFNYDLHAIAEDLKREQVSNGRKVITLVPKKPAVLPMLKVDSQK